MNLSDGWVRIQVYLPETLRYAIRTSEFYEEEATESSMIRKLLTWCVQNQKDIDLDDIYGMVTHE